MKKICSVAGCEWDRVSERSCVVDPIAEYEEIEDIKFVKSEGLKRLTARQRKIYKMRFVDGCTLEAIGKVVGVSRERIRQIEARIVRKMRFTTIKIKDYEERIGGRSI
jgi:RNA polymerase sigma factor (sigma-70 family)